MVKRQILSIFYLTMWYSYCILIGNVRLVDDIGNPVVEGYGVLQMYATPSCSHIKEWRYVCDDEFDLNANGVKVACKELGYIGGEQQDATVQGDSVFWDDVQCSGSENSLADCERSNQANCGSHEAVKLTCTGTQNN